MPLKKARPSVPSPQLPFPLSGVCRGDRFLSGWGIIPMIRPESEIKPAIAPIEPEGQ